MEILNIMIVCILGLSVLHTAECGCKEDMMADRTFLETCLQPFGTFMGEAAGSGQDIMKAMCTEEGKAAMTCLFDAIETCPDFMQQSQEGGAGMPPGLNFTEILAQGGMNAFCNLMSGPCSKIAECFSAPDQGSQPEGTPPAGTDMSYLANVPSSYQQFQAIISVYCGPMHSKMKCVFEKLADCPESIIKQTEKMMKQVLQKVPQAEGQMMPTVSFDESRKVVLELCPKMPKEMSETCVGKTLGSSTFTKCYKNITDKYTTDAEKKSCKVYFANRDCILNNVEPKCGKEVANFLVQNSPMILDGPPSDCKGTSSGTRNLSAAIGTIMMLASFLVFRLL